MPANAGEETKEYLMAETEELKLLSDYGGLDFEKCLSLDCYTYKLLLRDALIYKLKQSEAGREYLENCWMLQQTEPDRKGLRGRFGGEGECLI